MVTVGGIIPPKDYRMLEQAGVKAIFGPGTNVPKAARRVLELIATRDFVSGRAESERATS